MFIMIYNTCLYTLYTPFINNYLASDIYMLALLYRPSPLVTLSPVSRALEPVQDVCAAGVIYLVKGVCVRLLHGNRVAVDGHTDTHRDTKMSVPTHTHKLAVTCLCSVRVVPITQV